jgi:hypothetical protein
MKAERGREKEAVGVFSSSLSYAHSFIRMFFFLVV